MSFRENLTYLRAEHSMTQEQLAAQLGISRQSVAKWEAGKAYPEMDKLICLCQIFSCTMDDLVMGDLVGEPVASNTPPTADAAFSTDTLPASGPACESGATATPDEPLTSNDTPTSNAPDNTTCAGPDSSPLPSENIPLPDDFENFQAYNRHMKEFARKIAGGCLSILLGVSALILISGTLELWRPTWTPLGLLPLFIGVGLGVHAFVTAGFAHSDFMRNHPCIKNMFSPEERSQAARTFATSLAVGLGFIFVGVVACALADNGGELREVWASAFMLLCVAIAVFLIVQSSIMLGRLNLNNYNKERFETLISSGDYGPLIGDDSVVAPQALSEEQLKNLFGLESTDSDEVARALKRLDNARRNDQITGSICGCIMIIATIAGLVMLFVPEYENDHFWMSWVIGGLLCGVASIVVRLFNSD